MSQFIPPQIQQLAQSMSSQEPSLLAELRRETHLKVLYPQMLSSALQGRFLSFFSQMLRPKRILEIGTYTGYSCLCLAEGLAPEGILTTIEVNPERGSLIRKYLTKAGLTDRVQLLFGPAMEILPTLSEEQDLVFLDADKAHYPDYYDAAVPMLRAGGILIADNVLWHGKVLDPSVTTKEVKGIRALLKRVEADDRVEQVFLPLWDGWLLVRKKY